MSDLQEFKRWQSKPNGGHSHVAAVIRWERMPEYQKQNLRRRWAKEDAAVKEARDKKGG